MHPRCQVALVDFDWIIVFSFLYFGCSSRVVLKP